MLVAMTLYHAVLERNPGTTHVDVAYCYRRISVVYLSVCLSVTIVSPAKTTQPIEMSFAMWTRVGPRQHALDGGTHWRNLAYTIDYLLSYCVRSTLLVVPIEVMSYVYPVWAAILLLPVSLS